MAPEVSSTTVKLQWLNDKLTTFGGCGWQKNQKGLVENTIEMVAWSNSGRIDSGSDGFRLQLFVATHSGISVNIWRWWWQGSDGRLKRFSLLTFTVGEVAENWRYGWVGFAGYESSLTISSPSHMWICFSFKKIVRFTFFSSLTAFLFPPFFYVFSHTLHFFTRKYTINNFVH